MYESTFHLGMRIHCTYGTPAVDSLNHLLLLPLVVDYKFPIRLQEGLRIYQALWLCDRVSYIHLHLPPSIMRQFLVFMGAHFPRLDHLSLSITGNKFTTLTLPKAFHAPTLRHLDIPCISPPRRLKLLTSTVSLVTLVLKNIQTSSYFRPRLLASRIWSLPQPEELSIGFSIPIPRPSSERELLGEPGAPVTLPNLKTLRFRGVSTYLESFVAQVRVPLLERLDITLFNQIAFALPHLFHLINIPEGFKLPTAKVFFDRGGVSITTAHHSSRRSDEPFRLHVMCEQLDWQIDCAIQICSMLIPAPSDVERFTLDFYDRTLPIELQDGGIDSTTWLELLSSFIGMKELRVCGGLLEELCRALQVDEVGSNPGFLPDLQDIVCNSRGVVFDKVLENNLLASFIDARRITGHPVRFLRWRPRIKPKLPTHDVFIIKNLPSPSKAYINTNT